MSNQNKTTLIKGNAAIAESNYEGFLALCTDDTEWTFVGDRILKGKEAVRQYMAITYIEPPIVTVDNLIAEGDFLTAVGKITIRESDGKVSSYKIVVELFVRRLNNTQDLDPDSVFNYGLSEVARIRKGMDSIKTATGFKGDLPAFFNYVKTDKKFFPFTTEQEVLDRFRSFQDKMSPSLSRMFNLTPKSRFEIRATEKFRQAGANAQYMRPARDGSRPGIFYEVIPDALSYNVVGMETLFLHEAIPGHHFQIALQHEMTLPEFRGSAFFAAFSEGWGLYAETLGLELGMYTDPYQYFGHLNANMERSVRLVVDVGLHHKGWTREKAIEYVLANQPLTAEVAAQHIERYMVTPGQALSYKIGERKILFLRKLAQQKLGKGFDIREFHDQILKDGAMPLDILDQKIRAWIDCKLKSK